MDGTAGSTEPISQLVTKDGSLELTYRSNGVVVSCFRGHFSLAFAEELIRSANRLRAKGGPVHSFHDWWDLEGHDSDARTRLTRWALETRRDRTSVHILVNVESPLMAMAVTASNLVLGGVVQIHESRGTFERALQRQLALPKRMDD